MLINWGQTDSEVVNVTARPSSTTFTIARGQDGTTGVAHPIGATVDHGVSARDENDVQAFMAGAPVLNVPLPSDQGFGTWTSDPTLVLNDFSPTMGTVYLARVQIRQTTTISAVYVLAAGAASSTMGAYLGLYDSSGVRQGVTASTLPMTSTGLVTGTLSAPYTAQPGYYWVAFVTTVAPTTSALIANYGNTSALFNGLANVGLSASGYRFATNGTSKSSLPTSITPSSNTNAATGMDFWAAAA